MIKISQTGVQFKELVHAIPPREFTAKITQDKDNADATQNLTSVAKLDGHWGFRSMSMVIETPNDVNFPDATVSITISGVIDYVEGDNAHRDILFEQSVPTPMNFTQRLAPSATPNPNDAGLFLHGYPNLEVSATWVNSTAYPVDSDLEPPTAKLVMTCYQ